MKKVLLICSVLLLSGCGSQLGPDTKNRIDTSLRKHEIGMEIVTNNTMDHVEVTPNNQQPLQTPIESDKSLDFINLPEGFIIHEVGSVDNARSLEVYETEEKTVIFVGNRGEDSVYAAIDNDKDYRIDEVVTILAGRSMPNGIAFDGKDLYVADLTNLLVFKDIIDQLETREFSYDTLINDFPTRSHHGWKYLSFGPDNMLYMSLGVPCNICEVDDPFGTLIRIDPTTLKQTVIARGIRNSVGFDWNPSSNELWFTDNGRDLLGDNNPPDELNRLTKEGQDFGYPYCHGGDITDPKFNTQGCKPFQAPFAQLGPHVAALGMTFNRSNSFPETYANKVFIAEHGSRNRSTPIGYRISMVDTVTGEYEVFADGWLISLLRNHGRPVDLKWFQDGSLLISDDASGKLYRIVYVGK